MIVTPQELITFALVFSRLVIMMLMAPAFGTKEIFAMGKVAIVFWTAVLLLFYIPLPTQFPNTPMLLFFAMIVEMLIGALLGFIAQMFVVGIEFAGSLMDTQAGLSVASTLDPSSGQTTTLLSKILKQLGVLVFLLIDGHHVVLATMIQSFRGIPIGSTLDLRPASGHVIEASVKIFEMALQLSAPILLVVFLIDFGFGMLSRVSPQVNVFQLGFQLKPVVSLMVFLTIVPGLVDLIYYLLERVSAELLTTMLHLRV
ncbi:flagellar biosynthetic protein FliR [bacterium]|jgi:flagellar biosynthesis protein FliR|nr:flagellar biosynthetic protein FliR [bacterium]